jgi:hypothetical protein
MLEEKRREGETRRVYVEMKMDKERKVRRNEKHNSFTKSKLCSEVVVLVKNVSQEDRTNNLTNVRYSN